jgi:hypothetical protein
VRLKPNVLDIAAPLSCFDDGRAVVSLCLEARCREARADVAVRSSVSFTKRLLNPLIDARSLLAGIRRQSLHIHEFEPNSLGILAFDFRKVARVLDFGSARTADTERFCPQVAMTSVEILCSNRNRASDRIMISSQAWDLQFGRRTMEGTPSAINVTASQYFSQAETVPIRQSQAMRSSTGADRASS